MPGTYISPAETGLYYLLARYYDPVTGRFVNADGQLNTGTLLGYNLFAYCENNPVNRVDPTGEAWWEVALTCLAVAVVAAVVVVAAPVLAPVLGVAASTTAATAFSIGTAATAVGIGATIAGYAESKIFSPTISIPKSKANNKEKAEAKPAPPPSNGTTYYHVTSTENAAAVMGSNPNAMFGSDWEGGYVYAWRSMPSRYAIKNSGATNTGVIISFKTNAPFVKDTGITDPKVQMYGPVVSARPGPILVWDVQIVG